MNPQLRDRIEALEAERLRPVPPPPESCRRGPTALWLSSDAPKPADDPEETP